MDFNLQGMLDGFVLDKQIGVSNTRSPIELNEKDFIDLLNSGKAYDIELNQEIGVKNVSYYHVVKYHRIEFLTQTDKCLHDL